MEGRKDETEVGTSASAAEGRGVELPVVSELGAMERKGKESKSVKWRDMCSGPSGWKESRGARKRQLDSSRAHMAPDGSSSGHQCFATNDERTRRRGQTEQRSADAAAAAIRAGAHLAFRWLARAPLVGAERPESASAHFVARAPSHRASTLNWIVSFCCSWCDSFCSAVLVSRNSAFAVASHLLSPRIRLLLLLARLLRVEWFCLVAGFLILLPSDGVGRVLASAARRIF